MADEPPVIEVDRQGDKGDCSPGGAVYILLATFNGERFLAAQLSSILAQDCQEWIVLARDDGSSDGTRNVLLEYSDRDARIRVVDDALGNLGAARNFAYLAGEALKMGASYFAFCDQDDFWHPAKLATLRAKVHDAETSAGPGVPVLAFSDLRVVSEDGSVLADSYARYGGVRFGDYDDYVWLIAQNAIPGCAMLGNRALLELALPMPRAAVIHDWWFALSAAAAGRVVCSERTLIDYRVHGSNVVGVKSMRGSVIHYAKDIRRRLAEGDDYCRMVERQARAIAARLRRHGVRNQYAAVLENYLRALLRRNPVLRVWGVMRGPVRRFGLARNALMLRQLLCLRRTKRLG